MAKNMKDALSEIYGLARKALESDGEFFLSEHKVFDLAEEALAADEGTQPERLAMEQIHDLARTAVDGEGHFPEVDVLTAAERGLER